MKRILMSLIIMAGFMTGLSNSVRGEYLMYMPFKAGEKWYCVQGNHGDYSHSGNLEYAYDFTRGAYNDTFGKDVLSPVRGQIIIKQDGAPDYAYNNGDLNELNNDGWGNTLLIRDFSTGKYIRLSHMKDGSIPETLEVNDWVQIGQKIGEVGHSGWSSGPHLHMHMQSGPSNAGQSVSFTFIEGPIRKGVWTKSELHKRSFVIDDNKDLSLSHYVKEYKATKSTGWEASPETTTNNITGQKRYMAKITWPGSKPWYKWTFKLKSSGWYYIYVKYLCSGSKDPDAKYSVFSLDDPYVDTTIPLDQQACTADNWHFLIGVGLKGNKEYIIKLRGKTVNKYITADGVKLFKVWPPF